MTRSIKSFGKSSRALTATSSEPGTISAHFSAGIFQPLLAERIVKPVVCCTAGIETYGVCRSPGMTSGE